jgi:hypothetical protein
MGLQQHLQHSRHQAFLETSAFSFEETSDGSQCANSTASLHFQADSFVRSEMHSGQEGCELKPKKVMALLW